MVFTSRAAETTEMCQYRSSLRPPSLQPVGKGRDGGPPPKDTMGHSAMHQLTFPLSVGLFTSEGQNDWIHNEMSHYDY